MGANLVLDVSFLDDDPVIEPVTVADAKNFLKIDVPDDDLLLNDLITSAREDCENYLCISFIPRKVTAYLRIGLDEIRLPYGPVKDITALTTIDGKTTIESFVLNYDVFKALDPCNEVKAVYTAGYWPGNAIPKHFKIAILEQIAWEYEHRGDETDTGNNISPTALRRLKPYRRVV